MTTTSIKVLAVAALCVLAAGETAKPKSMSGLAEEGSSLMSTRGYLSAVNDKKLDDILEDHGVEDLLAEEPAAAKKESRRNPEEPSAALLKQIGADFDEEALLASEEDGAVTEDDIEKAVEKPVYYAKLMLNVLIAIVLAHGVLAWQRKQAEAQEGKTQQKNATEVSAAFREAVIADDASRCAALLDGSSDLTGEVNMPDAWLCTPLHVAASNGSAEVAKVLLARGADMSATDAWDQTPLHFAARAGSAEVCALLVDHGAALDAKDTLDFTPLIIGAKANQAGACKFLLDQGATTGGCKEEEMPALLGSLLFMRIFDRPFPAPSVKMEYEDEQDSTEAADSQDWDGEEKDMMF